MMPVPHYGIGVDFERDPRVLELRKDYLIAHALYVAAGQYCVQHLTNGHISKAALEVLTPHLNREEVRRARRALVRVQLWTVAEGGWQDADFRLHNLLRVDVEDKRARISEARQEAGRRGGRVTAAKRRAAANPIKSPSKDPREVEQTGQAEQQTRSSPSLPETLPPVRGKGRSRGLLEAAAPPRTPEGALVPPANGALTRDDRLAAIDAQIPKLEALIATEDPEAPGTQLAVATLPALRARREELLKEDTQ